MKNITNYSQQLEFEERVLTAILFDRSYIKIHNLDFRYFTSQENIEIFSCLEKNQKNDFEAWPEKITSRLVDYCAHHPTARNDAIGGDIIASYIHRLISNYQIAQICEELQEANHTRDFESRKKLLERINSLSSPICEQNVTIRDNLRDYFFQDWIPQVNNSETSPLNAQIHYLSEEIQLRRGEVSFIAGTPGAGKTALACQLINNYTERCYLFSLEMPAAAIFAKLAANKTGVLWTSLIDANKHCLEILEKKAPGFNPNVTINENGYNIAHIVNQIKLNHYDCKLFIIDYIGLVSGVNETARKPQWEIIADNVTRLKEAAKSYNVSIICLSQLTRENSKEIREPHLGDLSGSKVLENTADWILMLWKDKSSPRYRNMKIAKNRYGIESVCNHFIEFDGVCQRFTQKGIRPDEEFPKNKKNYDEF